MPYPLPRIFRSLPFTRKTSQDPLDHPALRTLSPRDLADLPRPGG